MKTPSPGSRPPQDAAGATGAVRMELGGDLPTEAVQPRSPAGQEIIGLLVAIVVLLVAFGSVIAMGLPIGIALVGLATEHRADHAHGLVRRRELGRPRSWPR